MCGICGILDMHSNPVSTEEMGRMTDTMAHRGPDGRGVFTEGPVGLGHRRLAIIDLSDAGSQPMASQNQRYHISYNGEVYNFKDLGTHSHNVVTISPPIQILK